MSMYPGVEVFVNLEGTTPNKIRAIVRGVNLDANLICAERTDGTGCEWYFVDEVSRIPVELQAAVSTTNATSTASTTSSSPPTDMAAAVPEEDKTFEECQLQLQQFLKSANVISDSLSTTTSVGSLSRSTNSDNTTTATTNNPTNKSATVSSDSSKLTCELAGADSSSSGGGVTQVRLLTQVNTLRFPLYYACTNPWYETIGRWL